MSWQAVHPDTTEWITPFQGAPEFEIGFWPPREAERFGLLSNKLHEAKEHVGKFENLHDQDAFARAIGLDLELTWDMVRWGVRDWRGIVDPDGEEIRPEFDTVEVDGRQHKRLSEESVRMLYHSRLVGALFTKVWLWNVLTPAEKKTSGLRLESLISMFITDAKSALQGGEGDPSESSGSTTTKQEKGPTSPDAHSS